MNKREEIVRELLVLIMYVGVSYKLYTLPQTHGLYEAIIDGRDGIKPYLFTAGIIIAIGLIHKGINWVFRNGNR